MSDHVKITPAKMLMLGAAWFGNQFFWGFHTGSMPLFLGKFTNLKFMISIVLSLAGVAGCIVPPIAGYLSDRSNTRFGRRKPYILVGMFGVLLCLFILPHLPTFWLVVPVAALMYSLICVAQAPYLSLLPDITPVEQRSTATGVMYLLGSIGMVSFFLVSSGIWDRNPVAVFNMVAVVSFGFTCVTIALVKEPSTPAEAPKRTSLSNYIKSIVEETNFLKYFISQSFCWLGIWMVSGFLTLFVVQELKVPEGQSLYVLMVLSVVATVGMLPLGMLGDRIGRKGLLSCMIGLWAIAQLLLTFSQNFTQVLIIIGVAGISFATVMGIGYVYTLDLIPRERTAEFLGFNSISICIPQIIGPLIGGKMIDTLGYRSIFPATALFMVISLVILQFTHPRQQTEALPAERASIKASTTV